MPSSPPAVSLFASFPLLLLFPSPSYSHFCPPHSISLRDVAFDGRRFCWVTWHGWLSLVMGDVAFEVGNAAFDGGLERSFSSRPQDQRDINQISSRVFTCPAMPGVSKNRCGPHLCKCATRVCISHCSVGQPWAIHSENISNFLVIQFECRTIQNAPNSCLRLSQYISLSQLVYRELPSLPISIPASKILHREEYSSFLVVRKA